MALRTAVEVEIGPVCRAGLDVLDLVREIAPHLPDGIDRDELLSRALTLIHLMESSVKGRPNG